MASEFDRQCLRNEEFTYLDLNSGIDDFKVFKKCIVRMKQNYFEKAGDAIFGIYERPPLKPFKFHAHVVIAKSLDEIDRDLVKQKWQGVRKGMKLDSDFSIRMVRPWRHTPYKKFYYYLKPSKLKPWLLTKPFGNSGTFHFHSNLGESLPWAGKQLPKQRFTPQQLKVLINQYFSTPPLKNKVESLFDFYDNYST